MLFAALLFPAGFAGWAVGHYTSLGKSSATVVHTVTVGSTTAPTTTSAATTTSGGTTKSSGGGGGSAAAGAGRLRLERLRLVPHLQARERDRHDRPGSRQRAGVRTRRPTTTWTSRTFIEESIDDPDAYIAKGYTKGIMPTTFGKSLSRSRSTTSSRSSSRAARGRSPPPDVIGYSNSAAEVVPERQGWTSVLRLALPARRLRRGVGRSFWRSDRCRWRHDEPPPSPALRTRLRRRGLLGLTSWFRRSCILSADRDTPA